MTAPSTAFRFFVESSVPESEPDAVTSTSVLHRPPFFYGWYIAAFAFMAQLVTGPYVAGVFFKPMTEDLEWSRGDFALANTFATVVGGLTGFLIGPMVDRSGARWLIASGAAVAGLSLMSLAFITELWQFWLIRGLIYVLGAAGMSGVVVNSILSKWFVRKRGRAIALSSMGLSAGAIALAPIVAFIIETFGWRTAWVTQGVLIWVVMILPAALIVKRQPEDVGLLPDGDVAQSASERGATTAPLRRSAASEEQWTRREAVRTKQLWFLIFTFGLGGLPASAIVLHLIPFLQDAGFSVGFAVFFTSLQHVMSLLSKPFWGYCFDRFEPRFLVALGWGLKAIPLLTVPFLASGEAFPFLLPLLLLYGLGIGSSVVGMEVIWAHYFGRRHIGAVRSVAMPFSIVFGAGGTWFAGAVWDLTGSYTAAFVFFAALTFVAIAMILVGRPPKRAQPAAHGVPAGGAAVSEVRAKPRIERTRSAAIE